MVKVRSLPVVVWMLAVCATAAQGVQRFSAQSELVVLHVLVTDRNGAYADGLDRDAFRVFEDNRPRTIDFFAAEDAPVTVGLLIDASSSMAPMRDRVIAASTAFVKSSNASDEVFALIFSDEVHPAVTASHFTSDANTLEAALAHTFVPGGRTSLYDAVADGLAYVATGSRDRRVLVIISDGGDNASRTTFDQLLARAQASSTVIDAVTLLDPFGHDANPRPLRRLAATTGGTAFEPRDVAGVERAIQQIARDIRHSYTIGYEPAAAGDRSAFHRIHVDVRTSDGRRLVARTRQGYLSGQLDQQSHAR
jgi:VWFA-related protein